MKLNEYNNDIMLKNVENVRNLEQFYTDGIVDDMLSTIEKRKTDIVNQIQKYAETHEKPTKWDDDGNPIAWSIQIKPLVISNYFFKSIAPITSQEPMYNAEKLGMVFDYYCEILAEVNDKIGDFPSSLTSFCKFAGITLNTLRNYKSSPDFSLRTTAQKIYDQIGDENLTMGQMGVTKEKITMFKLKSQNEYTESSEPKININIVEKPDLSKINARLDKYKQYAQKKKVISNAKQR